MSGTGHRIQYIGWGVYRLSWYWDKKVGRLRWPTRITRDTDEAGAQRFSKKWKCAMPAHPQNS